MKAKVRVPVPEASNPNDWLRTRLVAAEFRSVCLDETEDRAQQPRNPGNVGRDARR
jgi:hypothetical protein